MRTRVYYGEALAAYGFGQEHPFGSDRLNAFWQEMTRRGLDRQCDIGTPVACGEDDLALFHTEDYIARVKRQSQTGEGYLDYGDTPAFPGVFEAASAVVGSVLDGLKNILEARCRRVFVPIAGLHHARRDSAAGFCVFNDPGVAIEALRKRHGIRRVAYVDIDAHHGDGVFYAFEDDPDLIFADIHEDGRYLYPGTGAASETGTGAAKGTKLNLPLEPGADDTAFHRVWPQIEKFVRAGKPEFIILQAGADSIAGDPITHMQFTPAAHAHAATRLCALADEFCQGRIIALGGGGYDRPNLAAAWTGVVEAMLAA
ncbi:MAG: histone deacetylase [Candidatus Muproteobacteria bacterium RIFCSPHIGHO2_12_FULL_60_33]|uniref:Acetoin utilization protein AcuC n=1 Tax=Candidatus Muproteobacteria bacterium RIFCSPLOWO2_01_FULL_60_18 TaxID=1817768 RepID=A0A1F6U5G0_9PROT|nr:MAG: histone deacetylase [Candidatus Muproteobacteria bacterium RIFCSPLOWO2_01_FULL_60_18]OGI54309.1 MAG: histone deacetylase [Candidatus Muproteobacteria bacterium RIFCSPHIGHO2_12_FULL_60_33]OGI55861.1 MAG: histone deacetylase [Candidatus Muproteobacteria bacterium RIFCSPHIGHO2_02_FULL_60_13]OGI59314.1 MAG: histone deacetylase [Candidatus Muproteobacteria bacterium RIFCSPHIGHO2_01_FULL_61_200]